MVDVTLMGKTFDVAPYKLGMLRKAAPIVDRVNATAGALTTMEGAIAAMGDLVAFVSLGLQRLDPDLTPEALDEQIGFEDLPALQAAFTAILRASGFKPGEAKVPSAPADAETDSTLSSAPSSSSSSQPA